MPRTLIKHADWILTMDPKGTRYRNADLLLEDNQILEIGPDLDAGPGPVQVIDATGKIITPGFVNTHHHTFQSLVRNIHIANGLKLEPWLMVSMIFSVRSIPSWSAPGPSWAWATF